MTGLPLLPLLVFTFAFIQPTNSLASTDPSRNQRTASKTQGTISTTRTTPSLACRDRDCPLEQWCLIYVKNIFLTEHYWQPIHWECVRSSKKGCDIAEDMAICYLRSRRMNTDYVQLIRRTLRNMTEKTSTSSTTTHIDQNVSSSPHLLPTDIGDNVTTTDTTSKSSTSESSSANTLPAADTVTSARSSPTTESEPDQLPSDKPFTDQPPAVHKADSDFSNDNQSLSKTTVTIIIVSGIILLAILAAVLAIWYIRCARKKPKPDAQDTEHTSKKERDTEYTSKKEQEVKVAAKNERIYDAMSWADTTTHATTQGAQDRGRIVRTEQPSTGAPSVIDGVEEASTVGGGNSSSTRSKAKSLSIFSDK